MTLQAGSDLQETQTPQLLVLAQPYGQDTAVLSQSGLPLQPVHLPEELVSYMEEVRLGKREL